MRHDVFVSYSKADRDCAFEVTARLEAHGHRVWIAPRDVSPSADWAEEIIDAIAGARVMVLVFSAHSNGSPQVRREVERAVFRQLAVLPFRIDDIAPSKSLEYFLSLQHWLDAFPVPQDAHYARLCATVSSLLSQSGHAAPAAAGGGEAPLEQSLTTYAVNSGLDLVAADLNRVVAGLAEHVGPMARILVSRATAKARSMAELKELLAGELESDAARRRFLAAVADLGAGT